LPQDFDRNAYGFVGMNMDKAWKAVALSTQEVAHRLTGDSNKAEIGHPLIVIELRQVTTTRVRNYHHNDIIRSELRTEPQRGEDRSTGRTTYKNSLLPCDALSSEEGIAIAHHDHAI